MNQDQFFYFEVEEPKPHSLYIKIKRQLTKQEFEADKTNPLFYMANKKDWQWRYGSAS